MSITNGLPVNKLGLQFQSFKCAYCGKYGGFYSGVKIDYDVFCSEHCLDRYCGKL